MIIFFITLFFNGSSIIIDTNQRCSCSEVMIENDCNSIMNCRWVNQKCKDFVYECFVDNQTDIHWYTCNWNSSTNSYEAQKFECSQFKSQFECSRLKPHCFWNQSEMCSEFTSCEDYNAQYCPIYFKECSISDNTCINGLQPCENNTSEQTCKGVNSQSQECLWGDDKKCKGQSLVDCSSLTGFKICDINLIECKKNAQGNCESLTCGDNKLEKDCTNTRIVKQGQSKYYICIWENNLCQEAKNAQHLSRDTCSKQTAANYKWVNEYCQACSSLSPKVLNSQKDGYVDYETQIVITYLSTFILSKFLFVFLFID